MSRYKMNDTFYKLFLLIFFDNNHFVMCKYPFHTIVLHYHFVVISDMGSFHQL